MTIFLESASMANEPVVTLEEAYQGLLELAFDMQDLNEALLIADYQVDKEVRALTEAGEEEAATEKKEGLFKRAGDALKNAWAKTKAAILKFYNAAKAKLTTLWNKLKQRVKELVGKGYKVFVAKDAFAAAKKGAAALNKLTSMSVLADKEKASALAADVVEAAGAINSASGEKSPVNESAVQSLESMSLSALETIKKIAGQTPDEKAPEKAKKAIANAMVVAKESVSFATAITHMASLQRVAAKDAKDTK